MTEHDRCYEKWTEAEALTKKILDIINKKLYIKTWL